MHRFGVSPRVVCVALALMTCVSAPPLEAQYFGRNKVEYRDFDYRLLQTAHFDIYYDRRDERAVRLAARMAERWYERLSAVLDHEFTTRQPLVLYGSHPAFGQTNIVAGQLDEAIGGVTESGRRRIAMPFAATLAQTDHVLGHEIVHAFQFDMARRYRISRGFPLWFAEGMAEYLSVGPRDPLTAAYVRDALDEDAFPSVTDLGRSRRSPYRFGHAFWAWLVSEHGESVVREMMRRPPAGKVLDRLEGVTERTAGDLGHDWGRAIGELYAAAGPDEERSRPLVRSGKGRLNIAPAISPDGSRVVFVSERDGASVDLYLADARTGEVVRRLLTSTRDIELESMQYVHSAGAWRPDGNQLAFAAVRRGAPVVLLIDPETGRRDREIRFPQFGEVLTPAWSPDGRSLAFAALDGGLTDLYIYEVESRRLTRLTDDEYADLQPAWSPDGRQLAFATERFTSDLEALAFGPLQIGLLDLDSRSIARAPEAPGDKAMNPQWSPDGSALYVVSDPGGVSDVFRVDLASGAASRVTAMRTSVTGLTESSPALSVAARAGTLAFSVLHRGRFEIRTIDAALQPCATEATPRDFAQLAPASSGGSLVTAMLADAHRGLPTEDHAAAAPYRPRLGLDGVAQPFVSSGSSRYGSYMRAGASVLFDDLMGEQLLGVAWQAGTRIYDLAVDVRYLNRERRWNWGIATELRPLVRSRSIGELVAGADRPLLSQQTELRIQTSTRFAGFLAYPFSRARRVELGAGVRHIDFDRELRRQTTVLPSGRRLQDEREDLPAADDVVLGEASVAFVHDNARWGVASPRMGSRWRAEAVLAGGELSYQTLSVDYRRYFMPVRAVTIAARIAPSIRLGAHADDPRLFPMYAGSRVPVRGYYGRTLTADCAARAAAGCIPGDDLFGHRVVAGNLELRVPFTVMRSASALSLSAEALAFVDAAYLWSRHEDSLALLPWLTDPASGLREQKIRSFGMGVRLNALGMIVEVDAVRPLDRLRNGWTIGLFAKPGF